MLGRYYPLMEATTDRRLRPLIERLARLATAEDWGGDVNPTQMAALRYLGRANRFSRAPSHVAEYLGATRGTVSQTLQALGRKGLVAQSRGHADRRRASYELTPLGEAATARPSPVDDILAGLPEPQAAALADGLTAALAGLLRHRGRRPFGICRTCRHHEVQGEGGFCRLLKVPLLPPETLQICIEQEVEAPCA